VGVITKVKLRGDAIAGEEVKGQDDGRAKISRPRPVLHRVRRRGRSVSDHLGPGSCAEGTILTEEKRRKD